MLNLDHTMLVSAATRLSQPVTFVRVPAGFPDQLQPSFADLATTGDIFAEQPWQVDCDGFLQDSFDSRESFPELFPEQENELREETNAKRRSSKNELVSERARNVPAGSQGSELIAPRKTTSVGNDSLDDFLRQTRRSFPIRSPKKSPPLAGCGRQRRERANAREKQRVVTLKRAMNVLKDAVPAAREKTKITKLEVLKLALQHIAALKLQLVGDAPAVRSGAGEDEVASSTAFAFEQKDLFVYCNDSQQDRAVTMANSWDDLA